MAARSAQPAPASGSWRGFAQALPPLGQAGVALPPSRPSRPMLPRLQEDIYRWATIWPCALHQTVFFEKKLNPKADVLLTPEEREMYYR